VTRSIRYIEGAGYRDDLAIVTTTNSMWSPAVWFGFKPYRHTKAYHVGADSIVEDFNGRRPPADVERFILNTRQELRKR